LCACACAVKCFDVDFLLIKKEQRARYFYQRAEHISAIWNKKNMFRV